MTLKKLEEERIEAISRREYDNFLAFASEHKWYKFDEQPETDTLYPDCTFITPSGIILFFSMSITAVEVTTLANTKKEVLSE